MKIRALTSLRACFDLVLPGGRKFDVVGLGQNAVDHICVLPQYPRFNAKSEIVHYEKGAGGMVAGALVFAARMGLQTKYVGKIGSDDLGRFSGESLLREGIDTSSLVVAPGVQNHCSFILVDRSCGERTILWHRDPRLNFTPGELRREDVTAGRILLLDGDDHEASFLAAGWAQAAGIPVVIDLDRVVPNSRDLLPLVDFLIMSANVPPELTGLSDLRESLRALHRYCPGFLAVTLGAQGAMAALGDECIRFPAVSLHPVDTTGAGDIFHGAFIYGLLQNWPLSNIMAFANAAAGLKCMKMGARNGIAPLQTILQLADRVKDTG
jgi:sulfofructose kinase